MRDLFKYFPHEKVRPIQEDLIRDSFNAMSNDEFLLSHAPTGIGKTAAVLTSAIALAKRKGFTIFFSTPRHSQQEIVVRTAKKISDLTLSSIVSKKSLCLQKGIEKLSSKDFYDYCNALTLNNECVFLEKAKKIDGISKGIWSHEDILRKAKELKVCGYEYALRIARDSDIILLDYNYLFAPFIRNPLFKKIHKKLENSIIIIDEAHNLGERVKEFHSYSLSLTSLRNALKEAKELKNDELEELLIFFMDIYNSFAKELRQRNREEGFLPRELLIDLINEFIDFDSFTEKLWISSEHILQRKKISFLRRIANFLDEWLILDDGFIRLFNAKDMVIEKKCMDPSLFTKEVFNSSRGVLMSGTLRPLSVYSKLLGVDRAVLKEYRNPFPKNNKLWIVMDNVSTRFSERKKYLPLIMNDLSVFLNSFNENIAIFFPSYELVNMIKKINTSKRLFIESRELSKLERNALLKGFSESSNAALIAVNGGSFSEGIDLPNSVLRIVVIVGLPLSIPSLEVKATINYFDKKFGNGYLFGYQLPAITKTLQAAGRVVRSEKDRGVVILMDYRYNERPYNELLDKYIVLSNASQVVRKVNSFLKPVNSSI